MKKLIKPLLKGAALVLCIALLGLSCKSEVEESGVTFTVKNQTNIDFIDQTLGLQQDTFIKKVDELGGLLAVVDGDKYLDYQLLDKNSDGISDKLLVNLSIKAGEEKTITVKVSDDATPELKKRTQAELSIKEGGDWVEVIKKSGVKQYEYQGGKFKNISSLRVPDNHTDHSFFIRYEGPGWESDKVGYRFYLDWRNAVDIFAKGIPDMVLQNVGQDGFDSYHEFSDWGMDVLKVGNSLGIGSIGFWDGNNAVRVAVTDSIICTINENGNLYSAIETNYYGWKDPGTSVNLESIISIKAGSRVSWEKIKVSDVLDNLCTGIVKHEGAELLQSKNESGNWAYIATFGKQSLNDDNLGMFVVYQKSDLIKITEDLHSYVLVLNPTDKTLKYGFGAVWEKDVDHISTQEEFISYLDDLLITLNTPLEINY